MTKRPDSPLEKAALTLERAKKFWGECMSDCPCYWCKKGRAFRKACAAHRAKRK